METKLYEINVTLSRKQKEKIFDAFINNGKMYLILENDALTGNDTILVPEKSLKWDIDDFVSDKKTSRERFEWDNMLDEETFSEMRKNGFTLVPSKNNEGLKKYKVRIPPTVVERLEKARKNDEIMEISLNYSLLTKSTKYSVFKNMVKLMENIPSLRK